MDWKDALKNLNLPDSDPSGADSVDPSADTQSEPTTPRHPALEIIYERKGRGGKEATIVAGFTLPDREVAAIASRLKSRLATGGSARGGEILIQGDRRADVARLLREMSFKVKGA